MRYKLLGQTGLRVSELALGTMTFGEDWGWGASKATSRKMFEIYTEAGGNFLDTANMYTNGTSEEIVGDLIAGDRDRYVVATKYTLGTEPGDPNAAGNQRKNMHRSVKRSLERLGTDHIDLLWVHAWDPLTPIEATLRGLDDLVRQGKVHHIGFSDAPAWVVAHANAIAKERGWTPFEAIQIQYNLVERTPEHELLPMAKHLGITPTIWSPLAQGVLTGKYLDDGEGRGRLDDVGWELEEDELAVARVLAEVADDLGVSSARLAIAWLLHQGDELIPIVGARTPEQLEDDLASLDLEIPAKALERLDEASDPGPAFPMSFLEDPEVMERMYGGTLGSIDAPGRHPDDL